MSSVDIFELGTSGAHMGRVPAKWEHVRANLDPDWKCPYCGFLSDGFTGVEQLQVGINAGRNCCRHILDAVNAWCQHDGRSTNDLRIHAWHPGFSGRAYIFSQILLSWPGGDKININIFRSSKYTPWSIGESWRSAANICAKIQLLMV